MELSSATQNVMFCKIRRRVGDGGFLIFFRFLGLTLPHEGYSVKIEANKILIVFKTVKLKFQCETLFIKNNRIL